MALREIHVILTEKLAFFLSGRAKDLSAPLYEHKVRYCISKTGHVIELARNRNK